MASYRSKLAGLGLLTRRLCSRLIGSQPSNITTIISEQIVKRFLISNNLSRLITPPMYRSSELLQSRHPDLNREPVAYKAAALPVEL